MKQFNNSKLFLVGTNGTHYSYRYYTIDSLGFIVHRSRQFTEGYAPNTKALTRFDYATGRIHYDAV